ncbi:MarR family winged helix-turn-helix transcriptional regulator [Feifania hominis]|uniref:MarR family transcriptional regulator n=1 Tax=Feifania hominis TaxID=2763660 RepID=A0A926DDT8_9FIRM|nr:MarR family winged helix-turn-helix transcriptional regulator [Feifania hominis]MBC8536263.1 MarR family transcriptional regulator [Feifania hominis]
MHRQHTVGFAIRSMSNLMRRKMFELAPPPDGATEMGGQIMGFLCDHPERELYQRDVEEIFCIRRSTASRFLRDLEGGGLLRRESVESDARLKRLVPTQKARDVHENYKCKTQEMEAILTDGLTREEIDQFLAVSGKIRKNLSR